MKQRAVNNSNKDLRLLAVLLFAVGLIVFVVHLPGLSAQAISFDDTQYLTDNLLVQTPSLASAKQFLVEVFEPSTVGGYYQPLTMISLMVDYALGGREENLMPFHRTSLILHVLNVSLLILFLYFLFGRPWISAAAGLLFGLHPMTVETIAWVGERKTLLAAFFAFLCLNLYVWFSRKKNWKLYLVCLVTYVLALMSKPTALALPLMMLLLDYWPLKRLSWGAVKEKIPFFVIAGLSAVVTYISQTSVGEAELAGGYGLKGIWLVPCHNIVFYLFKIIWPVNLSSHYAFPEQLGLSNPMILAGVIGTCILLTALAVSLKWTRVFVVGWLIFFVVIIPTMQILRFSNVIASDKFVYLPSVGYLIILVSLIGWVCGGRYARRAIYRRAVLIIVVLVLAYGEARATRGYLMHWRDTKSLCKHMLKLTPDAASVHDMLGVALRKEGQIDEAVFHLKRAIELEPHYPSAYNNLGIIFGMQGKVDEAIEHFFLAAEHGPPSEDVYNNLGQAFQIKGELTEAVKYCKKALEVEANHFNAHNNLGVIFKQQGKIAEAIFHYRKALEIKPDYVPVRYNLGNALLLEGKAKEAIEEYRKALRGGKRMDDIYFAIGNAEFLQGHFEEAVAEYEKALQINPRHKGARRGIEKTKKQMSK